VQISGGKFIDCEETLTCPECEPIAVVFRIVENFTFLVDMLANLFESIIIVFALIKVRWRPYIWFSGKWPLQKK